MKILGIVTLFNPPADLADNLASYVPWLGGVYLWDNTPGGSDVSALPAEVAGRVVHHRTGRNVGIAQALNAAMDFALSGGYTHLLTMDQDSRFAAGSFEAYRDAVAADTDERHYAFAPLVNRPPAPAEPLKALGGLIVSGSIFTAHCLRETGHFLEPFVIDMIDTEYAFRIGRRGGRIMLVSAGSMNHSLGQPLRGRLLWFHPVTLNYSPMRTYYIVRNLMYMHRAFPAFSRRDLLWQLVWKRPLYILLMERHKRAKLQAWCRGVWQGWRRRLDADPYFDRL